MVSLNSNIAKFRPRYILITALVLMCFSSLSTPAQVSPQHRPMTVQDAIEMEQFIDPYPFNPTSLVPSEVKFSPDRQFFAIVTSRGILSTNELEATVWIFEVSQIREFLISSSERSRPQGKAVVRLSGISNEPIITELRWISSRRLAFLGRNKRSTRSIFVVNISTCRLERLTKQTQDVTHFDVAQDTIVYTSSLSGPVAGDASLCRQSESHFSSVVITGKSLLCLLGAPGITDTFGKPSGLWVMRHNVARQVIDHDTGKQITLLTDMLSLAPSGNLAVVTQHAVHVPSIWETYEPAPGLSSVYKLRASGPTSEEQSLLSRAFLPKQYAIIDLATGKIQPVNAPLGGELQYLSPKGAIWSRTSRSVLLLNTFLPPRLSTHEPDSATNRNPCAALLEIKSFQLTCVAPLRQSNFNQYWNDGTIEVAKSVEWNQRRERVSIEYWTYGSIDKERIRPTFETYHCDVGKWVKSMTPSPESFPLEVEVRQDLNHSPALFGTELQNHKLQKLWDPNPQLARLALGDVSIYKWQSADGRHWVGGLTKPPDYIPGRRYPLVIQTHGFRKGEFMTVGTFTTAFAARPLAGKGILVLQVKEQADLLMTPQEAAVNAQGYLSAVEHLVKDGLADPEHIGIIGFSRTGYYVLEALTASPNKFAAATIADSDFLGYMQLLLSVDVNSTNSVKQEGIAIYGTQPFGVGLRNWVEKAPAFNLDKITVPLRIEVHDLYSLLMHWELYAALRLQNKPVDLIQLPNAPHILTKPQERFASEQGDVDWFDFWLNGHENGDPQAKAQYLRWRSLKNPTQTKVLGAKAPYSQKSN